MKRTGFFILVVAVAFAAGWLLVAQKRDAQHATAFAAWQVEKAALEDALNSANNRPAEHISVVAPVIKNATPAAAVTVRKPTAQELIEQLKAVRIAPGPGQNAAVRQAIVLFNNLALLGPGALPDIRQFLALNQDVDYDWGGGKGQRDLKSLTDAVLPASLRFGLFEVARQIGGPEAEKLLAQTLNTTGRGVEVAYLARVLEEITPGSYRDAALATAHDLLGKGAPVSNSALDRFHRDYLYDVLKFYNDASYVATAQSQIIQPDGKVDRSALRYLEQTLGAQSVALAAQAYQDPRVTDAEARASLARVALSFVGANEQAGQMFHTAILDQTLKPDHRRELVEDLNSTGLNNKKAPTPEDLQLVQKRYELTQAYLQQDYVQQDKVLIKAFNEADKDLRNALQRAADLAAGVVPTPGAKTPKPKPGNQQNQ